METKKQELVHREERKLPDKYIDKIPEMEICLPTPENAREEAILVSKYVMLFEEWSCHSGECVMTLVP